MGLAPLPPGYILSSSDATLESLELSRLNAVSNLRKELHQVVEEWIEAEVQARVARLMRHSASIEQFALSVETPGVAANLPRVDAKSVESLPSIAKNECEVTEPEQRATPAEMLAVWPSAAEIDDAPAKTLPCTRSRPNPLLEEQKPLKRDLEPAMRSLELSLHSRARYASRSNRTRVPVRRPRMPFAAALKQKRSSKSSLATRRGSLLWRFASPSDALRRASCRSLLKAVCCPGSSRLDAVRICLSRLKAARISCGSLLQVTRFAESVADPCSKQFAVPAVRGSTQLELVSCDSTRFAFPSVRFST
jgi:hypothetical protein